MVTKIADWDEVVKFHGHSCMGLAMGYKVAEAALKVLGSDRDIDEEMVAVVENDNCSLDAIQYLTGCTIGKGNLIFKDYGKPVYTFSLRPGGKSLRLVARGLDDRKFPGLQELRQKVMSGEADEQAKKIFAEKIAEAVQIFLNTPAEETVDMRWVEQDIPEKARIFNSIVCQCCGEKVMEPRARVKDGKMVCLPCAEHYKSRINA